MKQIVQNSVHKRISVLLFAWVMWSCRTRVRLFRVNVRAFVVTQMTAQMIARVGTTDVSRRRVVDPTVSLAQLTKIVSTIQQMIVIRTHPLS